MYNFNYYYGNRYNDSKSTVLIGVFEDPNDIDNSFCTKTVDFVRGSAVYKRTSFFKKNVIDVINDNCSDFFVTKVEDFNCESSNVDFYVGDIKNCFNSIVYAYQHNAAYDNSIMPSLLFQNKVENDRDVFIQSLGGVVKKNDIYNMISKKVLGAKIFRCKDNTCFHNDLIVGKLYVSIEDNNDYITVIGNNGRKIRCSKTRFVQEDPRLAFAKYVEK